MLDREVREKFKEFQEKSRKYGDLDIDAVRFEKVQLSNNKYFSFVKGKNKYIQKYITKNSGEYPILGSSLKNNCISARIKSIDTMDIIYDECVSFNKDNAKGSIPFYRNYPFLMDRHHLAIIPTNIIDAKYLKESLVYYFQKMKFGWGDNVATVDEVQKHLIPIPKDLNKKYTSFVIQKAIVEFLEYSFDIQDKIKQTIDKRYDIFTRLREALIPSTFHRDYVKVRFAKYAKEKGINFNITDVEFELQKLNNISQITMGQSPKSEYLNRDKEGLPFYQGKTDFGIMFLNEPTRWTIDSKRKAKKDDILISLRAPAGVVNIANIDLSIGRGLASIRVHDYIENFYLFYFLKENESKISNENNKGGFFSSMNKEYLYDLNIPIPKVLKNYTSLEIQKIIAKFIEDIDNELQIEFDKMDKAYKALERLHTAYLARTFTLIDWGEK